MLTQSREVKDHPHHEEKYDELELYPFDKGGNRDFYLFIEERKHYKNSKVEAFSIVVLCNCGEGYRPYIEIQHEPRSRYSESNDLKNDGLQVWILDDNYERITPLYCNNEADFGGKSDAECYIHFKNKRLDQTINDIIDVYPPKMEFKECSNND